ncbi:MAG: fumarylacetoacetase [Gemmatimonadaceae bacterium]
MTDDAGAPAPAANPRLDDTHRRDLECWVESASGKTDFTIQNLPLCVFDAPGEAPRVGIGIGEMILDLSAVIDAGLMDTLPPDVAAASRDRSLNALMALGRPAARVLRQAASLLLRTDTEEGRFARGVDASRILVAQEQVRLLLPAMVGDYTDFYASVYHATNVGSMFRPDSPLLPNYKWVPIGYHGRASSLVAGGTPVRRPRGQLRDDPAHPPVVAATRRLDYELEVGAFVCSGNTLGEPIPIERAEEHLFGLCLVNDWSARDVQTWEYQPLGPFLAKSFATTVSPWVVTLEALEPFRAPAFARGEGDPAPLPYLANPENEARGGFDITLEVHLRSAKMRDAAKDATRLSRSQFTGMYWTMAQMLTHHASNGCNLRPGDLIASGTVSGPEKEQRGCLLELTWRGGEPITLPTGEERRFLEDGDEVVMRAWCEREGFARIGFGECRGEILPAR